MCSVHTKQQPFAPFALAHGRTSYGQSADSTLGSNRCGRAGVRASRRHSSVRLATRNYGVGFRLKFRGLKLYGSGLRNPEFGFKLVKLTRPRGCSSTRCPSACEFIAVARLDKTRSTRVNLRIVESVNPGVSTGEWSQIRDPKGSMAFLQNNFRCPPMLGARRTQRT